MHTSYKTNILYGESPHQSKFWEVLMRPCQIRLAPTSLVSLWHNLLTMEDRRPSRVIPRSSKYWMAWSLRQQNPKTWVLTRVIRGSYLPVAPGNSSVPKTHRNAGLSAVTLPDVISLSEASGHEKLQRKSQALLVSYVSYTHILVMLLLTLCRFQRLISYWHRAII